MRVRVRMYRQGLGDCFLLTFGEGPAAKHALIDCGSLGATTTGTRMQYVARSIHDTTGRHLDLLIATHEHKDHVSGFLTEQETFDDIAVGHVWQAWTEDSTDPLAKQIQKYRGDLITAAKLAATALEGNDLPAREDRRATADLGAGIRKLLAFVDEDALAAGLATTVNEAMAWVTRKTQMTPEDFLRPERGPLEPDWLPGVRFDVLGPPRDPQALAKLGEHGSPELYGLAIRHAADLSTSAGFFARDEPLDEYHARLDADGRQELARLLPFDLRHRFESRDEAVRERFGGSYYAAEAGWRRIDFEWLTGAADLALQLDGQTNNTSLALAIELVDDGRVLLFPADAQVGNWLSWHERRNAAGDLEPVAWKVRDAGGQERTVTAADLLRRTVLYKVGHHASHNATIREKGLELMASDELVAMIPVDREVALRKTPPWQMPARELYRRLIQKARGRVLRSDVGWAARDDPDFADLFNDAEWNDWRSAQQAARVEIHDLFIDWFLD
jgi:hypothetical protein